MRAYLCTPARPPSSLLVLAAAAVVVLVLMAVVIVVVVAAGCCRCVVVVTQEGCGNASCSHAVILCCRISIMKIKENASVPLYTRPSSLRCCSCRRRLPRWRWQLLLSSYRSNARRHTPPRHLENGNATRRGGIHLRHVEKSKFDVTRRHTPAGHIENRNPTERGGVLLLVTSKNRNPT